MIARTVDRLPFHVERTHWLTAVAALLLALLTGRLVAGGTELRLALLLCLVVLIVGIWAVRPMALLYVLVVWTIVLGTLRRVVSYELVGAVPGTDLLLLVGPFALLLLTIASVRSGAARERTRLAQLVLVYSVLTCFGALNPIQGSLSAGVVALIFFVPIGAFWAGRMIDDSTLGRVLALVAVLAIPAVIYGLSQLISGFPSWDASWIADQGYSSLNINKTVRQFASFSSASEYATYLGVAIVLWAWLRPGRIALALRIPVLILLVTALFYESSRTIVFILVATSGALIAAKLRLSPRVAVVSAAAALLLLPVVVSKIAPAPDPRAKGTAALVSHQVSGLGDPTGARSTLHGHLDLIVSGVKSAFTNPMGKGISIVTIAGDKFGGYTHGTEADPSNAAVALGLPGLIIYLLIVAQAFPRAYRLAVVRSDPLSFAALGVVGVTFLQWLNGGQYAVAYLPWLVLGWIDRRSETLEDAPSTEVAS